MSSPEQNDGLPDGTVVNRLDSAEHGGTDAVGDVQHGVKKESRKFLYTKDGDNFRGVVGYGVLTVALMAAAVTHRTKVDERNHILQTQQRIEQQMEQEAAETERVANVRFQSDLAQQIVDEVPLEGETVQWHVEQRTQGGGEWAGRYLMADGTVLSEKEGTSHIAEQTTLQIMQRRAERGEKYSFDPSSIKVTKVTPGKFIGFTVNVAYIPGE